MENTLTTSMLLNWMPLLLVIAVYFLRKLAVRMDQALPDVYRDQ